MKPIKLSKLLYHLYDTAIYSDPEITGLTIDSREVKPGDLFFAYKGKNVDGRKFIDSAIEKGATAILSEVDSKTVPYHSKNNVPIFPVHQLEQQIGQVASQFFGDPSRKLKIVGITGTNGKTSCSHFIAQVLQNNAIPCGVIGTLGSGAYGDLKLNGFTTPDAVTLQATLAEFVEQKLRHVSMEVSSHSLEQGRVNGIRFEVGVFTNLTRDHLDYHGTMEMYGAAKKRLFENELSQYAVINADDEFGQKLIQNLSRSNIYAYSVSKDTQLSKSVPLIFANNVQLDHFGIHADVYTPWGEGKLQVPIIGQFNLSNILATLTALCLLNIPFEKVIDSLSRLQSVPGRMQTFGGDKKPLVIVDYAHTPDALEKVLIALRAHTKGKLYCLFGCGGDRDKGKRPLMAKIAEQYADQVMITDDNPRSEDPEQILTEIMQGFDHPKKIIVEHNRSKAIHDIIQSARAEDCVLVAGKGAELEQTIGNKKIPFSDLEEVKKSLDKSY